MRLLDLITEERPLRMVWRLERQKAASHLVGSVHFFPYRFRRALRLLVEGARCVLVEGPLEDEDLREVARNGLAPGDIRLSQRLDARTLGRLSRLVADQGRSIEGLAAFCGSTRSAGGDPLKSFLDNTRPWMAFFSLWVAHLERKGWIYHMDRDAAEIGRKLGRQVLHMESLQEQIRALEEIPLERIVSFLTAVDRWGDYSAQYVRLYLRGDLDGLLGLSEGFPSLCEPVIDRRDRILYERMQAHLLAGRALVLVGAPHTCSLRKWLSQDGFMIRQIEVW